MDTSRKLPKPLRDDFAARIIGSTGIESQAAYRGVSERQVQENLERCDELLSRQWVREQFEAGRL